MNTVIIEIKNKELRKLPKHIVKKMIDWVEMVELEGIISVRRVSGFHDEPLKGSRRGQRSVRLSKQWRLIYLENKGNLEIIVIEVTPHKY